MDFAMALDHVGDDRTDLEGFEQALRLRLAVIVDNLVNNALTHGGSGDLRSFVGSDAPLEDDLTVLALRVLSA